MHGRASVPVRHFVRTVLAAVFLAAVFPAPGAVAQLTAPPEPPENPVTPEKAVLGKILFWEEQLSSDGTVACGTCHRPAQGGVDPRMQRTWGKDGELNTDDDIFGSPGLIHTNANGHFDPVPQFGLSEQATERRSASFLEAAYFTEQFWDGRVSETFTDPMTGKVSIAKGGSLEAQSLEPILNSVEMSREGRTWDEVLAKLARVSPMALATDLPPDVEQALLQDTTYPALFTRAFGDPSITTERIAFALATYQRTLVPDQTPWDRFVRDGEELNFRVELGRGFFFGQGRCNLCHTAPLFADDLYHNTGMRPPREDRSRENVTNDPADRGKFKTPSLRNVELRARFMHNGMFERSQDAIQVYNLGGTFKQNIDPLMQPLGLGQGDRGYLWAFIAQGLLDPRVKDETPPFDRPTLFSERREEKLEHFGEGGAGSGGFMPDAIAVAPPILGNDGFAIGVQRALGSSFAILVASPNAAPPGSEFAGVPLHVDLSNARFLFLSLLGSGAGEGYGTFPASLPDDPGLLDQSLYMQWFIVDPAAVQGLAASGGLRAEFF